jgi:hypothetical protein
MRGRLKDTSDVSKLILNQNKMKELKFDKETAEALYRIFCGLSSNCYENAEVYEEAKPNMKKAYEKVLDWGRKNCDDIIGETLKSE